MFYVSAVNGTEQRFSKTCVFHGSFGRRAVVDTTAAHSTGGLTVQGTRYQYKPFALYFMQTTKPGVSKRIFAITTIVLIVAAAAGLGLYASTVLKPAAKTRIGVTGGILNGRIVSFQFFENFSCTPSLTQLFPNDANATAAASKTPCEMGAAGTFPSNTIPVWGMVPAFGGLSVFGLTSFNATSQGYPTFNGTTVLTDCTGMGSANQCPDHPPYFYSPVIVMVENFLGKATGMMGLPEGVMPFPAHTHIVETDAGQADIPWDAIGVFVFDPNIFPNPVTGSCRQVVPSNLSNATSNCLTSTTALRAAMTTNTTAINNANAKNPMWLALGKPPAQVVIASAAGAATPSQYANANSNVDVPFAVVDSDPFPPYLG